MDGSERKQDLVGFVGTVAWCEGIGGTILDPEL